MNKFVIKNVGEISTGEKFMYVEWKINKFLSLGQNVDDCIRSPNFQFKDAKWFLCVYPNGETEFETAGCVDLLLVKEESVIFIHRVNYHIGIHKHDGTIYRSWRGEENFKNLKGLGVFPLMKRSVLINQSSDLVCNGVVTFFCYLQVKSEGNNLKPSEGIQRLVSDFKNLLRSDEENDVIIKIKNKEFKGHKAILRARSSAMSSILSLSMVDKDSETVDIIDCEPEAFQIYLQYLYSGCIENLSNDIVCKLYLLAEKFDDEEVKAKCTEFMITSLSVETFCDVFALSVHHNESALLRTVSDFFAENTREIIVTASWQSLIKENPVAANELYLKGLDSQVIDKSSN